MERTITVRGVGNISAKPDFIVIEMDIRGQSKTIPKLWPMLHQRSKPFAMPPFRRGIQKMRSKP